MKKKLMKQEIRETRKLIMLIYACIVIMSIVTMITALIAMNTKSVTAGELMVVFLLCAMMGIVVVGIVMAGRFYNLLFTEEGMIRLTLPVKNRAHLQTNVKLGILSIYLAIVIYSAVIGIMDNGNVFLVGELYQGLKGYYEMYLTDGVVLKALLTTICSVLAGAVVIANYYITFIFALAVSRRIVSKHGIMQKKGVIFIVGMVLFNIQLLVIWGITKLIEVIEADLSWDPLRSYRPVGQLSFIDFLRYDSEGIWVKDVFFALIFLAIYGITALVMYRICRNIMERKLEV